MYDRWVDEPRLSCGLELSDAPAVVRSLARAFTYTYGVVFDSCFVNASAPMLSAADLPLRARLWVYDWIAGPLPETEEDRVRRRSNIPIVLDRRSRRSVSA
jgi:hypothetical protein